MITWLSGHPIENFSGGWALFPFVGSCAHDWVEDKHAPSPIIAVSQERSFTSKCGIAAITDKHIPALGVGTWPKCKHCLRF